MNKLLGNSALPNYIKLTATGIVSLTYLAALMVGTADMLRNDPVPALVITILSTGLGMALPLIGIHSGASLGQSEGGHDASTPAA